ncbi:MAG: helix-turn-helix domain-containing protein [Candidatus Moraniibacteriota bacterium]
MAKKTERCESTDPVYTTLRVIGGKWKPLILWHLRGKPIRFSELMRQIGYITQKMLTNALRELEKDGLVNRTIYPVVPPKVEYSLTPYGKTLEPLLKSIASWGKKHEKRG